jgi:hypothetical protein
LANPTQVYLEHCGGGGVMVKAYECPTICFWASESIHESHFPYSLDGRPLSLYSDLVEMVATTTIVIVVAPGLHHLQLGLGAHDKED